MTTTTHREAVYLDGKPSLVDVADHTHALADDLSDDATRVLLHAEDGVTTSGLPESRITDPESFEGNEDELTNENLTSLITLIHDEPDPSKSQTTQEIGGRTFSGPVVAVRTWYDNVSGFEFHEDITPEDLTAIPHRLRREFARSERRRKRAMTNELYSWVQEYRPESFHIENVPERACITALKAKAKSDWTDEDFDNAAIYKEQYSVGFAGRAKRARTV